MSLSEARFHDLVDATQQTLEDIFEDSDLDIDLESSAGVLTVKFENGSQLIFSRTTASVMAGSSVRGLPLRLRRRKRALDVRQERRAAGRDA